MVSDSSISGTLEPIEPVARFINTYSRNEEGFECGSQAFEQLTPDFVGSLDNIKHLVRLIDSEGVLERPSGLTIHKIGQTLLVDRRVDLSQAEFTSEVEDECSLDDALLLLPRSLVEELAEDTRIFRASAPTVKNTFIHIRGDSVEESDEELLRYHSAPPFGRVEAENHRLQVSSLPRAIKDPIMTDLVKLGAERSIRSVLPFSEDGHMSPLSKVSRAVEWNIAGFSVLLGCDIVVMDPKNYSKGFSQLSSIKSLDSAQDWPSRLEAREAWLENSLLRLDRVAWVNKERKSIDLVTSTSELSMQADVSTMLDSIKRVLVFLHRECKGQGNTYCLVRGEGDSCLLYDVSDLPKDCDVLQVSPDLAGPIARVSYAISSDKSFSGTTVERKRLLEKAFRLLTSVGESAELRALVAIDLAGCVAEYPEKIRIVLSPLSQIDLTKSFGSETTQKLLVVAVAALTEDPSRSPTNAFLAKALLDLISDDRKSVECHHLIRSVHFALGRVLVFHDSSDLDLGDDSVISSLFLKLSIRESIPSTRKEVLILALKLLSESSDFEVRGVAHNELANEAFLAVQTNLPSSILPVTRELLMSVSEFSQILKKDLSRTTKRFIAAVLMNLSKAFKLSSLVLHPDVLTFPQLINRVRAISFARAASRISESLPESIVGTELFCLGSELVNAYKGPGSFLQGELDPETESIMAKMNLAISSSSFSTFFGSIKRISPALSIGEIHFHATSLKSIRETPLETMARGCLEMSVFFADSKNRSSRRAEADFETSRLIAESNENGSDALRYVNKSLDFWTSDKNDEWIEECLLLKTAIMYKLGEFMGSMQFSIEWSHFDKIKDCMRSICMNEMRNGKNSETAKKILEALIRKKKKEELRLVAHNSPS